MENKKIDFIIRQETPDDHEEIYRLIKTAFETAKVKDGDEQDFATQLRESENYIPELALVAEKDGKLIGHIMLTKTVVKQPDGEEFEALLVAPLSVLLEYRNMRVGASLMRQALNLATRRGYKAAFLCGDPNYYSRLGFTQTSDYGIHEQQVPDEFTLVHILKAGALDGVEGIVVCS